MEEERYDSNKNSGCSGVVSKKCQVIPGYSLVLRVLITYDTLTEDSLHSSAY